jgi:hypothetical protein
LDRASGGAKVGGEAEARQAKTKWRSKGVRKGVRKTMNVTGKDQRRLKGVRKTMNVAGHALGVIGGSFLKILEQTCTHKFTKQYPTLYTNQRHPQ